MCSTVIEIINHLRHFPVASVTVFREPVLVVPVDAARVLLARHWGA